MPREKAISSSAAKPSEPEEPVESDEKVDFEEANDPEEVMSLVRCIVGNFSAT